MKVYRSSSKDCGPCPLRSVCIGKSDFKKIDDSIDKPFYDRMHARLQTVNREKTRQIRSSTVEPVLGTLDAHIRRRLRAIQLRHWKRKRSITRRLIQRGVKPVTAGRTVYGGRKSTWALSHTPAVDRALRNGHWTARGLLSLRDLWREKNAPNIAAPVQLALPLG